MKMHEVKIYIVDDNEAVCDSLKFLFNSFYDIEVKIYHNPLLFLEEYSPDWRGCLLIDVLMPSMSGPELITELKKHHCKMGIIILSGHVTPDLVLQYIDSGTCAFISKPIEMDILLEKMDIFLHEISSQSLPLIL